MSVELDFDRPADPLVIVDTPIVVTVFAAEKPNPPIAMTAGTTGNFDFRIRADANEDVGTDIQDLFRIESVIELSDAGEITLTVTVTPILGDGTDGSPTTFYVIHDQNMDAWQTQVGRDRQGVVSEVEVLPASGDGDSLLHHGQVF